MYVESRKMVQMTNLQGRNREKDRENGHAGTGCERGSRTSREMRIIVHCRHCCCLVAKSCPTLLRPQKLQPTRLLCPWDSPGKNTAVGSHFLLRGIFPTQGSDPVSYLAGTFFTTEPPGKPYTYTTKCKIDS